MSRWQPGWSVAWYGPVPNVRVWLMTRATALIFAREGAKVAIADIREEDAHKVEAEIAEAGGEAMVIMLDVTREDQWENSVASVVAQFGKLDILVNNAGISGSGERDKQRSGGGGPRAIGLKNQ